jgi:uncharacterized protein (DUF3084 family)
MTGIWLIIIISLVSMAIAYMGDVLGKRIGKRRISIFGLRPKHTAVLITIITGAIISIATFALLLASSEQIRIMLLKTEEMQAKIQTLASEKKSLDSDVTYLRNDVTQLSDQILTSQKLLQEANTERDKSKALTDEYREDVEILSGEIVSKQSQLDDLAKNKVKLDTQINGLQSKLSDSEKNLGETDTKLKKAINERDSVTSEINVLNSNLTELEKEKVQKEARIKDLGDRISGLNTQITRMRTDEIAFFEGQRLYGFIIDNDLLYKDILTAINDSFANFNNDVKNNLKCKIAEPSPQALYSVIEQVDASKAKQSVILVFAQRNSFAGDQIPIEFRVLDQFVVYNSGVTVTSEKVIKKLNLFEARDLAAKMIQDARTKALAKGLLQDPFGEVLKFGPQSYNVIAQEIEKHRRPMMIELVTKVDIYRSDYLDENNLEFRIKDI